jgi:hypothetical protein
MTIIFSAGAMFLLFVNVIGLRKMLAYEPIIDIVVTAFFIVVGIGTFGGAQFGVLSGGLFSLILFVLKRTLWAEKYVVRLTPKKIGRVTVPVPRGGWERIPRTKWRNN